MNNFLLLDENFERLLESISILKIELDRDESDSYVIKKQYIGHSNQQLSIEDSVLNLIVSTGSDWFKFVNWNSHFVIFLTMNERQYIAVGIEKALPHPTRGAYLFNKTYILEYPFPSEVIDYVINNSAFDRKEISIKKQKIISLDSNSLNDFNEIESDIIAFSFQNYRKNEIINFRTLLISESNLSTFIELKNKFIIGEIPISSTTFSKIGKNQLTSLKATKKNFLQYLTIIISQLLKKIKTWMD